MELICRRYVWQEAIAGAKTKYNSTWNLFGQIERTNIRPFPFYLHVGK